MQANATVANRTSKSQLTRSQVEPSSIGGSPGEERAKAELVA